ncbi:MAG: hypothetical protein HQL38_03355 [Alphaproteobacteria bacterium]|nr:hypothetical protein [Alphaproteobacteria bacterium]
MSKESKGRQAAGPHWCRSIASAIVHRFAETLACEAAAGTLTPERIRALAAAHEAEDPYSPLYRRSWDDCSRAREAAMWEQARRFPFDRILMRRFAHLFPARNGDDGGVSTRPMLSRRVIAGFNLAVHKMIGPFLYEQCQRKSQAIVDRHREDGGGPDWEAVYADPEARTLANDVLVVVAHYFANFEKRREWFLSLVNSNLGPAAKGADDSLWQLDAMAFRSLMFALFDDMRHQMETPRGATRLRKRYGEQTTEALQDFFGRLE